MNWPRPDRALIYASVALLAVNLGVALKRRGGSFLRLPETIEAHAWSGPNDTHDVIVLCRRVRDRIPEGATVTVIRPSEKPNYNGTVYLPAVGNLPRHRIVLPVFNALDGELPRYVIAVREPFVDIRYSLVASFPEGALWVRK